MVVKEDSFNLLTIDKSVPGQIGIGNVWLGQFNLSFYFLKVFALFLKKKTDDQLIELSFRIICMT